MIDRVMPRYYRKSYRGVSRGGRDKYSVEQQAGSVSATGAQQTNIAVVPSTAIQGMRKVKHLTVSMSSADAQLESCFWALVYVPQGTAPSTMSFTGGTGMYEPNQFVMNCGVMDLTAGPARIHSPVSRNLNSGDSIYLLLVPLSSGLVNYVVRYAVTLQ